MGIQRHGSWGILDALSCHPSPNNHVTANRTIPINVDYPTDRPIIAHCPGRCSTTLKLEFVDGRCRCLPAGSTQAGYLSRRWWWRSGPGRPEPEQIEYHCSITFATIRPRACHCRLRRGLGSCRLLHRQHSCACRWDLSAASADQVVASLQSFLSMSAALCVSVLGVVVVVDPLDLKVVAGDRESTCIRCSPCKVNRASWSDLILKVVR